MSNESQMRASEWSEALEKASAFIVRRSVRAYSRDELQEFENWLDVNPMHEKAFNQALATWKESRARLRRVAESRPSIPLRRATPTKPKGAKVAFWAMAASPLLVFLVLIYRPTVVMSTATGESREATLEDGTHVALNTNSRILVAYQNAQRRLTVKRGDVLFDVAHDPRRPFVVIAGGREIVAHGTSFLVQVDGKKTAVTLLNGEVTVVGTDQVSNSGKKRVGKSFAPTPGERITFTQGTSQPTYDRPDLNGLTSWREGTVKFNDLPLAKAAEEMNRYSEVKLDVEGVDAQNIRVTGQFKTKDLRSFANAVALSQELRVVPHGGRLVLIRPVEDAAVAHAP